ncbi:hypothetical protein [Methylobacterium planeticum]|uniref:Uncharacterized protein n=1 Tax=Methylobacterium planeticum TaxID=2615211 RepID=A0A6N6MT69_9HYPH|nr:hypothetical protein [Methylobacterium planeticum]KAB1073643.1 hypothetical protein F6X51_10640 [Methylobacterium planeticum]
MRDTQLGDQDFGQPAALTLWPHAGDAKAVEPRQLPSLHDALREAYTALRAGTGSPWIITASGLILTPAALLDMMPAL